MKYNATIPKGTQIINTESKTIKDSFYRLTKSIRVYARIYDEDSEIAHFIYMGIEYTVSTTDVLWDSEK